MKKTFIFISILFILTGCSQNKISDNQKTQTTPNTQSNVNESKNTKSSFLCGGFSEFENEKWFTDLSNLYQKQYPEEYKNGEEGKFYIDSSSFNRKQACLADDYFIFTPYENMGMQGAFYSYNIINNKLLKSPNNTKYLAQKLKEINDDFVFFEGSGGSGDCNSTRYGKYYYKENIILIYKECGGCMDTEYKCNELNIKYQ